MNQSPFKYVLRHPYDTTTFKTKALRLFTNGGWLKRLLLQYINGKYSLTSFNVTGDTYLNTPTFKTEVLYKLL